MNLVLIGYRGTGKTTVARHVARALGWDWVDSDVEVELRAGRSIATIFADGGEIAFRDWESIVLAELVGRDRTVIAAGGGVVVRPDNRQVLATAGLVVWLTARVDTIQSRLAADAVTASQRPKLLSGGEDEIRQLLATRTPLYRACAAFDVVTDDRAPDEIAAEILSRRDAPHRGQEGK
jgi:shikimate kinase